MERRSFFPTVAGLLFGASSVNQKPSSADPEPEGNHDLSPRPATHTDLAVMFADIRKFVDSHPGAVVLSADDPASLLLGYSAFVDTPDGEVASLFTVRITSVRGFEGREMEMLSTAAGRRMLSADLMRGTV